MESAKQTETIELQGYDITLTQHAQQKIGIRALSKSTGEFFQEKSLTLSRLNYQAVADGLNNRKKELRPQLVLIDCDGISVLEVRIHFSHPLLPSFTETLACKKLKQLNQVEMMKNQLALYPKRFRNLREKMSTMKSRLFVGYQQKEKECRNSTEETIATIKLNQGTYLITVSYMAKITNQWIYVHLDKFRQKLIDQQGYYAPTESAANYNPAILRTTLTIPNDDYVLNFTVSNGNSYPATVTNAIITAQLLDNDK